MIEFMKLFFTDHEFFLKTIAFTPLLIPLFMLVKLLIEEVKKHD